MILAQAQPIYNLPPLPPGTGLTTGIVESLLIQFANFMIAAGAIIAVIVIVWSGIMYFRAGSDADAKNAKTWFKNGLLGALIILGVGVIILTIYNIVVTGTFFGGVPIGPGPVAGGPGSPCVPGQSICVTGTTCDTVSNICVRDTTANLEGEVCKGDGDCNPSLRCKPSSLSWTGKSCQIP